MKSHNVQVIADDFGYSQSSDKTILKLLKKQTLHGVAILATHNLDNCQYLPKHTICCLHVNLIEGKPVCDPKDIPTLVRSNGEFYPFPLFFFRLMIGAIMKEDLTKEITAQLKRLQEMNIHITEINSHQHTHALSPVAEIIMELAATYKITNIRFYKNIKTYSFKGQLYTILIQLIGFLSYVRMFKKIALPKTFQHTGLHITVMSWEDNTFDIRRVLTDEPHQIVCHPGLPYDSNTSFYNL